MLKKYLDKKYPAIIWSIIIFILLALPGSMVPKAPSFVGPQFDKLVHITLFGLFVFLWSFYYSVQSLPKKKLLRIFFFIFIIASAYGIAMEYVQKYFIPMRTFDLLDIAADMIGAGLAYVICSIILVRRSK